MKHQRKHELFLNKLRPHGAPSWDQFDQRAVSQKKKKKFQYLFKGKFSLSITLILLYLSSEYKEQSLGCSEFLITFSQDSTTNEDSATF